MGKLFLSATGGAVGSLADDIRASLARLASCRDLPPGLLVAVSGGPDSLALLIAARELAAERPVHAATVDHALRPEARAEALQVARWCAEIGIDHRTLVWHRDAPLGGNLQGEARAARYRLLAAEARRRGVGVILTAHHRDDQAETHILLRERGARDGALAGMRPWRDLEPCVALVRPFLDRDPADLAQLPREAGWRALLDPSNRDPRFARVRLRQAMNEADRADAMRAVARAARQRAAGDRALAEIVTSLSMDQRLALDPAGSIDLACGVDRINDPLLARAVTAVGGALHPPSAAGLAKLRQAIAEQGRATLCGCLVERRGETLRLRREFGRAGPAPAQAGVDGLAIFDRRFLVGPLPVGAVVLADGANVKRRTLPALRGGEGTLIPIVLSSGPITPQDPAQAVSTVGWRLWADLAAPPPEGLTARPQNAAKGAFAVGKGSVRTYLQT